MKSKKLVSILAITSILGTSIVTPFNVLAETPVQAAVSATAPTYVAPTTQNKVLEVSPGPYLQMVRFDGDYITLNLIKFVKGYGVRVVLPNGTSREFYSQYAAGAQNEFVYIYVGDQNLTSPYSFFSTEGLYSNGKPYPNSYHTFYTAQYMGYQYDTAFGQKVYNLFQDGSLSTIGSGVTQAEIDAARAAAANAPASPEKDKLVNLITKAQTEFTNNTASKNTAARDAVNALFTNNTPTSGAIKPTTTQSTIDAAKALANQVTDATQKAAMLADIQKAQDLLNTRTQQQADNAAADQSVKALYLNDNPATDAIKSITNQSAINKAQDAVNKVTDAVTKAALQKQVDRAQELLNNRTTQAAADQAQQAVANYAVNQLFLNNTPASDAIKASTNQAAIDSAQAEINKIKDPALKVDLQKNLNRAQELLNQRNAAASQADQAQQAVANYAVNQLFLNNTPASDAIKASTNQAAIDSAQAEINKIKDPALKVEPQKNLDRAQELLDQRNANASQAEKAKQDAAKKAVDELFNSNTPTSGAIKPATNQKAIDDAQKLVDAITDPAVKAERQADLNKAQDLLDAKNAAATEKAKQDAAKKAVDELFNSNTPTSGAIKPATNQKAIDDAQKAIDAVTDATIKSNLQKDLDKAQQLLDATSAPSNYSLTANDAGLTATAITGTVGKSITSVRLSVDGTIVKVGQIDADGTYSIATNKFIKAGSKVEVVGYEDKTEKARKTVTITNDEKPVLGPVTVDDDVIRGSVTAGSATSFRISINGVAVKTGAIAADGTFQSSIGKQAAGTVIKIEIRDTTGYNTLRVASTTVTGSAVVKLVAPTLQKMEGNYIVGTAPKGTELITIYENGVAVRTQNVSTMTVNSDGSFTFKAYVAPSATSVQVQAKNSDKRMTSDLSTAFTK